MPTRDRFSPCQRRHFIQVDISVMLEEWREAKSWVGGGCGLHVRGFLGSGQQTGPNFVELMFQEREPESLPSSTGPSRAPWASS
jgi:hypothetical protein